MFETTLSYQKPGYIDNGWIIPMPEPEISIKKEVIPDSAILGTLESYAQILRHSEESVLFREFLLVHLNNNYFHETYPRGIFIEDKESLKKLVRENIPEDVKGKYWRINEKEGVSYVKDFSIKRGDQISGLITEARDLEERLSLQEQIEEFAEPTPMDPREYDAIRDDLRSYSVEEVISRWGQASVEEVLYADE